MNKCASLALLSLFAVALLLPRLAHAMQEPAAEAHWRATVISATQEAAEEYEGQVLYTQQAEVLLKSGPKKGEELSIRHGKYSPLSTERLLEEGDKVIVTAVSGPDDEDFYIISDAFRLGPVIGIIIAFFVLIIILSRLKGLGSLIGLAFSIGVIVVYVVPSIAGGANPVLTSLIGSFVIIIPSYLLAHGIRRRTAVAMASSLIAILVAALLSSIFVSLASLFGTGTEEAMMLQYGPLAGLNLQGLLLAGIIIGVLGVLDDITIGQAAAIDEVSRADPSLGLGELYRRGMSVGREHITSMVNTLALAYIGAALPLFLLLSLESDKPWWLLLNSEFVSEEIIRTLVGSISLALAAPLAAIFAAWACSHRLQTQKKKK